MHAGGASLRGEMQTGFAALRDEMHAGDASLRGEMQTGFAALRDEMHAGDSSLRDNIERLRNEMQLSFSKLDKELVRRSLSDKIWMFSFAAGLITVMARGFKWI